MARRRNGRNDRALIAEVKQKLRWKRKPDIMDWTLALMRRGFSKDEAKALFFKEGYAIDDRGYIVASTPKSIPVKKTVTEDSRKPWSTPKDSRQFAIEKTLAEMEERTKRMDATFAAAKSGRLMRDTSATVTPRPTVPETKTVNGLLSDLYRDEVKIEASPSNANSVSSEQKDIERRLQDLDSGWERLRRLAKDARGNK